MPAKVIVEFIFNLISLDQPLVERNIKLILGHRTIDYTLEDIERGNSDAAIHLLPCFIIPVLK